MSYVLKQTRQFARTYKKLRDNVVADVDAAALVVAADPSFSLLISFASSRLRGFA